MLAKGENLGLSHVFLKRVHCPRHTSNFLDSQEYVGDFQSPNSLRHSSPECLKILVSLFFAPIVIHCSRQQQQVHAYICFPEMLPKY